MANTWQCPSCKQWINQGLRNEMRERMKHLKECDPAMHARWMERKAELDSMPDELAPIEEQKVTARAARVLNDNDEPKPEQPKRRGREVDPKHTTIEWLRDHPEDRPGDYHYHIDSGEVIVHRHDDNGKAKHDHDGMVDYGVSYKLMIKKAEALR